MKPIFFLILGATIFGCNMQPQPVAIPLAPQGIQETNGWPKKEYADLMADAIRMHGPNLLSIYPTDWKSFCRNQNLTESQKVQFYVTLFAALAKFESNFNQKATYKEAFKDRKGNNVISAGLLQLSVESGNAYGCGLKSTSDLFDPKTNLSCGARIANRWVGSVDKLIHSEFKPWKGMARYWSPFRKAERYSAIKAKTMALSFCK